MSRVDDNARRDHDHLNETPSFRGRFARNYVRTLDKIQLALEMQIPRSPQVRRAKKNYFFPENPSVFEKVDLFGKFFFHPDNTKYPIALEKFIAERKIISGSRLKGSGIPCLLLTNVEIIDPSDVTQKTNACFVSVSGLCRIPDESAGSAAKFKPMVTFCRVMSELCSLLSAATNQQYIFLNGRSENYYLLIEMLAKKLNDKKSQPEFGEAHKHCAERSAFHELAKIISEFGEYVVVKGSQAYAFETQHYLKLSDEKLQASAASKQNDRYFRAIPPCNVCQKHTVALQSLITTSNAFSPLNAGSSRLSFSLSSDSSFYSVVSRNGRVSPVKLSPRETVGLFGRVERECADFQERTPEKKMDMTYQKMMRLKK